MPSFFLKKPVVFSALALLALAAFLGWRQWRGPEVAAYEVVTRPLLQQVVASGEVRSQALARIGSEITGVIRTRHVREGDTVQPGDVLLELNSDEPQARVREAQAALQQLTASARPQAQATLREAQNNLEQARRERVRREQLLERQLLSTELVEQARRSESTARAALDRAQLLAGAQAAGGTEEQQLRQRLAAATATLAKTRISASVTGIVQTRNAEPGDLVQPGRTLLEIAPANSREIVLQVDEKNMAPLRVGQPAQIIADAFPDQVLTARVSFIAPAVDSSRGTVDVHLDITTPAAFLSQGMTVSATIETGRRDKTLVVANDALRSIKADRAEVLRMQGGKVERASVRLGLRGMIHSEVTEGLKAGDRVLIGEAAAGQRVRVRLQAMPAGAGD
ncbi:MAG: efflux RND transporter periplasmic adaptor subunit [bacterium]|nr:efflux RND transporter periplasmic adaptor subunit [bacterium]